MARGRSKKRGRKKTQRLDPEAVLDGRVEVDLQALLELTRRIKPAEQGLAPSEEQRRRGLANRLLSLLIKRFADDLAVDWESRARDLANLRLRHSGKPAGQAVVSDLEPDAQAWIRDRLGGQDSPAEAIAHNEADQDSDREERGGGEDWRALDHEPEVALGAVDEDLRGLSTAKLLRRGRAALQEYDYEEARRHMWQACRRSRGALEASLELAEVLVNHLAAYQEALQMLPLLSSAAAADTQLRQLLGMAAARAGDHVRAEQLVRALDGEGVVEVYLALATAALGQEDDEETGRYLVEARQHGLVNQELLHLEEQLAQLRARRWRPQEEEIEAAAARGEMDAAEELARSLLERWPDSAVARRILAEVDRLSRERRRQEVLKEAQEARARQEYATGAVLLRKALELGADRKVLEPRLQRWEAAAQQEQDRARTERVVQALGGDDGPGALMVFLDLSADQRRQVRQQVKMQALFWLEEMNAPRVGARARAAVDAVAALEQADAALEADDPARAMALLAPHGKALEGVEHARLLLRSCQEQQQRQRHTRASEDLDLASEAFQAGDLTAARDLLEGIDHDALAPGQSGAVQGMLASIHEQEETRRLLDRYQQCLAADDLIGARQAAALLEQRGTEQDRWRQQQQELTERVRVQWRIQVHEDCEAPANLRDHLLSDVHDTTEPWLTPDGEELVLVDCHERWLFVRQVELSTGRASRLVSLRTPAPMGQVLSAVVDGDTLWIAGARGRLLSLDRRRWDVLRWDDFGALIKQGETIERARVIPPGRYLWVASVKGQTHWTIRVVDLLRWRVHRRLPGFIFQFPACGFPEALVACRGDEGRSAVFTARGSSAPHKTAQNQLASDAAVHPDGKSLLLLHPHLTEQTYQDDTIPLALSTLAADGSTSRLMVLEDSDHESIHNLATSLDQGISFVLHWVSGEDCQLLALGATGAEAQQLYSARVPVGTCLVQDAEAWRVAAMVPSDEDVELIRLESQGPALEHQERAGGRILPAFHPPFLCHEEIGASRERADELLERLREQVAGQVDPWARQYFERHSQDVGALIDLRFALNTTGFEEVGRLVSRWTWERFPQDSRAALSHAEFLAGQQHWDEVRQVLEALPDADMDRPRPRHFYHLLGVAQYRSGEQQRALRTWELGARIRGGRCDLVQYTRFAEPMEDPPRPGDWAPGQPLSRQLRGAILVADVCLSRGDAAGAVTALTRLCLFRSRELQSLARLAEAYLRLEPADQAGRFHKAVALAALCLGVTDEGLARVELPVAGHTWDAAALADVAQRAAAWLEGYGA